MKLVALVTGLTFAQASGQVLPPATPVRPVIDNYYGTKVVDPYR